jgi:hypothetical protein
VNFRFTIVETSLNRAEFRWKWLRFLQHTFTLGIVLFFLALGFGVAILGGLVTSKALATAFFAGLLAGGFIAWAVIIISVVAGAPDRNWLASALERVDKRLLDRLNTLLFLERRRGDSRVESFAIRIAKQTQGVFAEKQAPAAFSSNRALSHLAVFIAVVAVTVFVYRQYTPWQKLELAQKTKTVSAKDADKPLEIAPPATNSTEQNLPWGEVRITDPGSDLKVTKVDVVPLEIEAAANQSLKTVSWFSTVNGADEAAHELPAPKEPRYAVYQPTVYLDELRLSDWDVMTYYAKANTEKENNYSSEVYFLEVRPFREDILKVPGGEGGKAYQCLNEMSALIGRQQHIIRQTHQHLQKPQAQQNLQEQDRKKLSEAEGDLGESAQHLYAKMASEMENKPIGEALDNLAKAGKSLDRASKLLDDNVMSEAQNRERGGLAELVAARKIFQKALNEHPEAFDEPKEDEATAVADSSKKLNEMAEFRNESRAARDFVQKTLEQQQKLERQVKTASRNNYPNLAEQEKRLEKALEDFQAQHPQVFKNLDAESQQAEQAMSHAADSLQKKTDDARGPMQQATQQLQQFNDAMRNRSTGQQLANAYKLKEMLDKETQTLEQYATNNPKISDAEAQKTAREAQETTDQLKRAAEQDPTRDAFGQPLRDALSGTNKVDLDTKLLQVQQAEEPAEKRQRAGEAKQCLSKISKAFSDSEPKALQMAEKTDSLKPGSEESFGMGMSELESLARQLSDGRQVSPQDQAKQAQEALSNIQTGLRNYYGSNERSQQIIAQLKEMLKADALDVGDLKKLMDELRHFSVETSDRLAKKEDKPDVTNIDPTRLPPAYRGRIQKYFQKLSEK